MIAGGLASTVGLGLFEHFTGQSIPFWAYLCLIWATISTATYSAWREEHRVAAKTVESLAKPDIRGTVVLCSCTVGEHMAVFAKVELANYVDVPTNVSRFLVKLRRGDRTWTGAQLRDFTSSQYVCPWESQPQLVPIDYVVNDRKPLVRAIKVTGWVKFWVLGDFPWYEDRATFDTVVIFEDGLGGEHQIKDPAAQLLNSVITPSAVPGT